MRSLMIKPVFDLKIICHFKREDFHPKPGVDVVLLHLKKSHNRMYCRPNGAITSISFLRHYGTMVQSCGVCLYKHRYLKYPLYKNYSVVMYCLLYCFVWSLLFIAACAATNK